MPDTISPEVDVIDHGQTAGDAEVGVNEQLQGVEAPVFCIQNLGAPEVAKLIEPTPWARSRDPSPRNLGGGGSRKAGCLQGVTQFDFAQGAGSSEHGRMEISEEPPP